MKAPFATLLVGSLGANIALGYLILYSTAPLAPSPSSVQNPFSSTAANHPLPVPSPAKPSDHSARFPSAPTHPWSNLATDDLVVVIQRLRAAGFPPSVISVILEQRYQALRAELSTPYGARPYWKSDADVPKDLRAQLEHARATYQEAWERVVGPISLGEDDADRANRGRHYGDLAPATVGRAEEIERTYNRRLAEIPDTPGLNDQARYEQAQQVLRELHGAMAAILTPDELANYDLRNSATATRLQRDFSSMKLTEAEYRSIYALQSAFDRQFPDSYDPAETKARNTATPALLEQIKGALTPERYADYQQAARPEYQQLNQLVARLDLPLSAAAQVATVQTDIEQRANAIRFDASLSAADRTQRLAALSDEASARISLAIGERGLEGYKQYGGNWLTSLVPAAPKKAPNRSASRP